MQEILVNREESGQRLDKFLRRRLPLAPSSFIYKMLRKKNITLRGKKADGSEKVETGDSIRLYLAEETILKFSGTADRETVRRQARADLDAYSRLQPLLGSSPVLYEDNNILVVSKPAGVLSQKAEASDISMNEWLRGYLAQESGSAKDDTEGTRAYRPSVCNRLDRNTGGILLCAKTLPGSRALSAVIRDRVIRKTYTMMVHGQIDSPGVIENELVKDRQNNKVRASEVFDQKGQSRRAVTVYRPVRIGKKVTMLEADLITGRSHQLRVHMASIGHPIVSDPKYGDPRLDGALRLKGHRRGQLLWCSEVAFPDSFPDQAEKEDVLEVLAPAAGRVFRCPPPAWWTELCNDSGQSEIPSKKTPSRISSRGRSGGQNAGRG